MTITCEIAPARAVDDMVDDEVEELDDAELVVVDPEDVGSVRVVVFEVRVLEGDEEEL